MRRIITITGVLVVLAAMSAPALAKGGWAVTTVVEMPAVFEPGTSHEVAFEIRQHGTTLVTELDDVAVTLHRVDGNDARHFPAKIDGTTWRATIETPVAGEWTWRIQPGWFEPLELGELRLAATPPAPAASGATAQIVLGLSIAVIGAAVVLLGRRGTGPVLA